MKAKTIFSILTLLSVTITKAQWATESSGFTTVNRGINSICAVNNNVVWATAYDTSANPVSPVNEFTRTTNGGATWTPGSVTGANTMDISSVWAVNKDTAWISMLDNTNGGGAVYHTNDGGTTWAQQTTATFAAPGGSTSFVHFFDKNNGVCVGDSNTGYWEIYTTANGGTLWSRVAQANIPANLVLELGNQGVYSSVGNTIWFGTDHGRVYKSSNKGATWTVVASGLSTVTAIAFRDTSNGIITNDTLIYKTTNGGSTWSNVAFTGYPKLGWFSPLPGTSGGYMSTNFIGSAYTLNDGQTWTTVDSSIVHGAVTFLNSSTGWSGGLNTSATVGGMYKWTGAPLEIKSNSTYSSGTQLNVFPNPFNNQLTININPTNHSFGNFRLEILDVLGNQLITERLRENNSVLNIDGLPKGIYFYKIFDSTVLIGSGRLIKE
ncbi:MAG TPA: T9SS type A sorting domain-containing protein [Bacteroidia bacterium]|jgi:photosystem II stability/assembly factor-like uncharacterized protein|nr:T9SS type A sorting domain-containing protein [Bacteroidia bacterium]